MRIGDRLREARKAQGYTQVRLAVAMGWDPGTISRWERGEVRPNVEWLERVAEKLDVSFEWLATGRGTRERKAAAAATGTEG